MNKILHILIILALIGVASAAVYVTTNPEACLWFSRDQPGPSLPPITTQMFVNGNWTNSIDIGTMNSNYLTLPVRFANINTYSLNKTIKINIECAEGLVYNQDGSIKDFESIKYAHPDGINYQCNNVSYIYANSDTKVTIIPSTKGHKFPPEDLVLSNIEMSFTDNAYGHYKLTIYVDGET